MRDTRNGEQIFGVGGLHVIHIYLLILWMVEQGGILWGFYVNAVYTNILYSMKKNLLDIQYSFVKDWIPSYNILLHVCVCVH